ncbi:MULTISPECIES: thiamine diphosphokinase [unclassified Leisingera]|uniref:thiamine diphosphokinase n=1 Tax=unclassified Leisingera TaxID=2614906 RepID=UPI000369595A|nr:MULTISPECIES: thiamine diphosphokinase [unclassified Leisingera]KIC22032.1 thiamine pyrophosphokinase [Leisingera sp. ANG-S3]KIC53455.1 thiamine pyrophosphokinase [Leisingera sp. ANG-S]KID11091.1 thiamine pyrophosphokinase [Leisingera sp. ANG1]
MNTKIVDVPEPITLVGGGEVASGDLEAALALAPVLVAADGGAAAALAAGQVPRAVIGDFDSLSDDVRGQLPPDSLHPVAEQDSTDFDKALRMIAAPAVLAVGFLGARVDHQLAAFSTLVQGHDVPVVLVGETEVIFHLTRAVELPAEAGEVISLFPMQEVQGHSEGLEWPIDGLTMSPMGRIGTSNRATGPVRLEAKGPGLLAIVPRRLLADVLGAVRLDR